LRLLGLEIGFDGPVFLGAEGFDFELAVADQTQRDRLHAPRRTRARQFAPKHRRQREPDEIVEGAAGEIGVDQFLVEVARMLHRFRHGLLGDRVEDHAAHVLVAERLFVAEYFQHMPGNGLAFAVGVGCEDQAVGVLHGLHDVVQPFLGLGIHIPVHGEVFVRLHGAVLGRQVPHMAVGGHDFIVLAQILVDGFRLGWRFYYDDIHLGLECSPVGDKKLCRPVRSYSGDPTGDPGATLRRRGTMRKSP
jgi:hypothetical protein